MTISKITLSGLIVPRVPKVIIDENDTQERHYLGQHCVIEKEIL